MSVDPPFLLIHLLCQHAFSVSSPIRWYPISVDAKKLQRTVLLSPGLGAWFLTHRNVNWKNNYIFKKPHLTASVQTFLWATHSVWLTMILIGSGVCCCLFVLAFLQINSNFLHFFDLKFGRHHRPPDAQLFLIWRQPRTIGSPGIDQNPQDWTWICQWDFSNFQINSILEIYLGIQVPV
jgi:hypothetical protein